MTASRSIYRNVQIKKLWRFSCHPHMILFSDLGDPTSRTHVLTTFPVKFGLEKVLELGAFT